MRGMQATLDASIVGDMIDGVETANANIEGVLKMKQNSWLLKVKGPENVLMFAIKVESDVMESYEQGQLEEVGIDFEKLDNALVSRNGTVDMTIVERTSGYKLLVEQEGYSTQLGLIDPTKVAGHVEQVPSLDYAVSMTGDISFIKEFVSRADKIFKGKWVMFSPREEALYLYSEKDAEDIYKKTNWDSFESYSVDWSKARTPKETKTAQLNPPEDHGADSIFSLDYFKGMTMLSDDATVFLDNEAPIKILFDTEDGISASYIMTPRIPSEDMLRTLPDSVMEGDRL